jgi:DNA polymerase-3 subunit delta'
MRGARRVAIVDDADHLSEEAANAFLKTLEEPPPGSALILVGTTPEAQLDTVVSRCRVLRFDPLPNADLAAVLLDQGRTNDPDEAQRLAHLGEGSVTRALALADPALETFRRALIDEIAARRPFDPADLAARVEAFARDAGKESVLQRDRASILVGELARFFRGVLWQAAGLEPPNPDPADRTAAASLAARLEPEDVFLLAERCLDADYQIQRRLHLPLIYSSLSAAISRTLESRPAQ